MGKSEAEIQWSLNFRKRKSAEVSRNDFLKTIPFFEHLTERQITKMAQHLHVRRYEENEYLFEVNHPGAALFIIMTGEVAIETSNDSTRTLLARIGAGQFLGELALLDETPRSASARATKPTQTFALFRGDLARMVETEPEIACEIYKSLAWIVGERLKATNRQINQTKKAG